MGLFSNSSPLDQYVEQATSENNTNDDWAKIMDVCDRIKDSSTGHTDGLKSITKRLKNDNPRVILQAITLLDACVSNCGRKFLLKVSERDFEQELSKLLTSTRTHHKVSEKLRECMKKWSEGEFKADPELGLIPALYMKLAQEGYNFEVQTDAPKKVVKYSSDPNVVHTQQEEDDIARAIQLSLQDSGSSTLKAGGQTPHQDTSLYSSASAVLSSDFSGGITEAPDKEPMKVRALYDFEAAEDNELTFKSGEIIVVIDNSDANWWKGSNHRGEGLFPSNFVTDKLNTEEKIKQESGIGKRVSFSESVEVTEVAEESSSTFAEATGEVDEEKVDQLLHLLHEADPTGERPDDISVPNLEDQVNAMAPTIDAELEQIDRRHAQLARISTDLVDALGLYHQLMRDMPPSMPYYAPYNKPIHSEVPNMQFNPATDFPPPYMSVVPQGMPPQIYPGPIPHPAYMGPANIDPSFIHQMAPMQRGPEPLGMPPQGQIQPGSSITPASVGGMMTGGYPPYSIYGTSSDPPPGYSQATQPASMQLHNPSGVQNMGQLGTLQNMSGHLMHPHNMTHQISPTTGASTISPANLGPPGGQISMTPQIPPSNVDPQMLAVNMAPQMPPVSVAQQVPQGSMAPPTSLPCYPVAMQQPLL